jgi:uncharacterized protein YggE
MTRRGSGCKRAPALTLGAGPVGGAWSGRDYTSRALDRSGTLEIVIRIQVVIPTLFLFSLIAQAQGPPPFVRAVGSATVPVKPDKAVIQFSVVTTAATAQDASTQNANQVTAVLAALTGLLGPNANIQTLSYSLSPNYNFPQNQPPVLTGYTASNTVQVTVTDLSVIGKVIDTGVQAGANRVQGLQFGLQDDQPSRQQALKMATSQAKSHADAMASGLGLHTGAAISIQEGTAVTPQPVLLGAATPSATTPVETGVVNVQASVTLEVAIVQ